MLCPYHNLLLYFSLPTAGACNQARHRKPLLQRYLEIGWNDIGRKQDQGGGDPELVACLCNVAGKRLSTNAWLRRRGLIRIAVPGQAEQGSSDDSRGGLGGITRSTRRPCAPRSTFGSRSQSLSGVAAPERGPLLRRDGGGRGERPHRIARGSCRDHPELPRAANSEVGVVGIPTDEEGLPRC